ncbi:MAG TPA: cytochrome c oxidase subunit 4 [Candidatus Limnocylindrales bacterium]|nr:cytochrome c oxidase subunit 4 [Candidatus Limnocylindrales bacterium]
MEEVGARLQDLWNGILDFTSKLVIPDWGSLISLIPILLLVVVVGFFLYVLARYLGLGPRRRGIRRLEPVPPPGVHAGAPSFAPILAAIGAFMLFVGLVVKGWFLVAGVAVLIVTLLYWGREAIRDYEHVDGGGATAGGAGTLALSPPPGIHMPGPSFRPILVSLAAFLVFLGLVAGPWLLAAGIFALVVALIGWLHDAGREYHDTLVADRTGHPPAAARPGYPVGTLLSIAVVFVVALVLNAGILPPKSATSGGGTPGASGAPAGGGGGGAPSAAASLPAADVTIDAKGIAFVQTSATAPASKPFTIAFDNQDAGTPHNVAIHKDSPTGQQAFMGEIVTGPKVVVYDVPALAAGTYAFVCSVHPNMTGTLTVK